MDRYDPNDWDNGFVRRNTAFCFTRLREVNEQACELLKRAHYDACLTGVVRILNGLITLYEGASADVGRQICLFYQTAAWITAYWLYGKDGKPRKAHEELVVICFEDARRFAHSQSSVDSLNSYLSEIRRGTYFSEFQRQDEETVRAELLDMLHKLDTKLVP